MCTNINHCKGMTDLSVDEMMRYSFFHKCRVRKTKRYLSPSVFYKEYFTISLTQIMMNTYMRMHKFVLCVALSCTRSVYVICNFLNTTSISCIMYICGNIEINFTFKYLTYSIEMKILYFYESIS